MLREMSAQTFNRWVAYDKIEPIDQAMRSDYMLGVIATLLYNTHKKASAKDAEPANFIPWMATNQPLTPEEEAKAVAALFGVNLDGRNSRSSRQGGR